MISINYQKRKNSELFKRFENPESLFLSKTQNYIPIYKKFFNLNDTNYNNINLNNKWFISNIEKNDEDDNGNIFMCKTKNINTDRTKDKEIFFKLAPLLDPFKYMTGKYDINNNKLFNLPRFNSTPEHCHPKIIDVNNSAYVDGLFLFLSSQLNDTYKFIHGVEYYGSYLALKNDFKIDVFDDIDYLNCSDFFNKNKNILFKVDDYEYLFQQATHKLTPITIGNNISLKSINSVDNNIFEDIFDENINLSSALDLNDLKDMSIDLIDMTNSNVCSDQNVTLKSNSSCSSRSSYTNDDDLDDEECSNCNEQVFESGSEDLGSEHIKNSEQNNDEDNNEDEDIDDEDFEEETIYATIPKFPVQVIGMEYCENTFDDLILSNNLSTEEWHSALMQIVMILITYQKAFNFTHNDLHTNNVMYNKTDKKYIYYCYKKKYYKVPTFGRLFKIIDFGRSIFKFDGKIFCSDSFQNGGDAATQYNTEPYFNDKKPRLEPNYSFDLCRLACSIFDYLIDDLSEIKDLEKCDPVKRLIVEWCLDDKGINLLYKNNGVDRYPDFKLYKMIARCVHKHTPQAQLERPEFKVFEYTKKDIPSEIFDIDCLPCYV